MCSSGKDAKKADTSSGNGGRGNRRGTTLSNYNAKSFVIALPSQLAGAMTGVWEGVVGRGRAAAMGCGIQVQIAAVVVAVVVAAVSTRCLLCA